MSKVFLYNHGGSENHGCEALVRTVCKILGKNTCVSVLSEAPEQDHYYNIYEIARIESAIRGYSKFNLDFIKAYINLKKNNDYFSMDILPYLKEIRTLKKGDVEISVGGDIYCYDDYPKFIRLHELICRRGCKTILLGCSLEAKLFEDPSFIEDMRRYDYISARETLTYKLLINAGIPNVDYNPDTAFTLPAEKVNLPERFIAGNTVGLNISPLVVRREKSSGIVLDNFRNLIKWILKNTDCSIALIPHVIWKDNDDRIVLKELFEEFIKEPRVIFIDDGNCMQLKGYISQCRFFVGARTHATIAAYSSLVPTLVLGYSIKSRGIAKDLFGTDENYVIPIEKLCKDDDMQKAFVWLWNHEELIRENLSEIMPEYINKAKTIKMRVEKAIGGKITELDIEKKNCFTSITERIKQWLV